MVFRTAMAACLVGALAATVAGQENEKVQELEERVDELEEMLFNMDSRIGSRPLWSSYSGVDVNLGGHVLSLGTALFGEDSSDVGHYVTLLELFVQADLSKEWSLFATPGFFIVNNTSFQDVRNPSLSQSDGEQNNLFLSRAYAQWTHSDKLSIQGGIFGTPHGVVNREYFIPSRIMWNSPLHTRTFLSNQLYPQNLQGLKAAGQWSVGDAGNRIRWEAYVGTEGNNPNEPTVGGRLSYTFADLGLEIAGNVGRGQREDFATLFGVPPAFAGPANPTSIQSPFPSVPDNRNDYLFGGVDVDFRSGPWQAFFEGYYSAEDGFEDKRALSAQTSYFWTDDWATSYRFDYFDWGHGRGHATEHSVGLMFQATESVRIRLDFSHQEQPNSPDAIDFINFGFTAAF